MSPNRLYIPIPLLISTDSRAGEEGAIRAVDHAVIGGVVAVVVFAMLCLLIILGRYFARHKGKPGASCKLGQPGGLVSPWPLPLWDLASLSLNRQFGFWGHTASLILGTGKEKKQKS